MRRPQEQPPSHLASHQPSHGVAWRRQVACTHRRSHAKTSSLIFMLDYRLHIRAIASHSASSPQPWDSVVTLSHFSVFSHTLPLLWLGVWVLASFAATRPLGDTGTPSPLAENNVKMLMRQQHFPYMGSWDITHMYSLVIIP